MSTSYYGLSTQTADVPNSNGLTATGGGSAKTQTAGSQTFNYNGFMELLARGGVTGVHGGINPPDGHGWLLDDTSLVGTTLPAGVFQALHTFFSSDSSAIGDIYARFYKLNILGAVYTAIGTLVLAGQTIPTTGLTVTLSASLATVTFNSDESLYYDLWWDQTGGGSATNLISVAVASTSAGVPGASGGFEVQLPSASGPATPVSVSDSATGSDAVALTVLSAQTNTASGAEGVQATVSAPIPGDGATGSDTVGGALGLPPLPTIPPPVMPLISQGVPAYASDISYAPSRANDALYGTLWRSVRAPTDVNNPGPVDLIYDLSGVPSVQRGQIVVNLLNEGGNVYLDTNLSQAQSLFENYELDGNTAAGGTGTPPTNGWVTLVSVTGNTYPTTQHLLQFAGNNWLRFRCTLSAGTAPNNDVSVQMDVHDAHLGAMDRWLFLGDSITLEGMLHPALGGGDWGPIIAGPIPVVVNDDTSGKFYPATIDGGNGGMTMTWAASNIAGLLNNFSGGFVSIAFGTNDCNQSFQFAAGDSHVLAVYNALLTCIDAAAALNNRVIVPKIPYGYNNGGDLGYNANLVNQWVDAHLPIDRPAALRGPDFWTYFQANQNLIRDGIHPTYTEVNGQADGYEQMHRLWASWMVANIYATLVTVADSGSGPSAVASAPQVAALPVAGSTLMRGPAITTAAGTQPAIVAASVTGLSAASIENDETIP